MTSDEKIVSDVLQRDSLAETEEILGKRHDDFTEDERMGALFKFMLDNEIKKEVLKNANDTYSRMSWKDFIKLIENDGFKLQQQWKYQGFSRENTAVVYERDGFLLIATSYDDRINGGHIYAEIEVREGQNLFNINHLSGGYHNSAKNRAHVSYDIREGLMNFINQVNTVGVVLPIYESKETRPWFATFEDEQKLSGQYDEYDKLRVKRISESSERVKALCSPFIDEAFTLKSNTYANLDLKHVNLTSNISSIESNVFVNCPNLEEIVIKSDVEVPIDMISNCPNLKKLVVHGVEVPLENGQVKDNSLTGIINGFKKQNDGIEKMIKQIQDKKEQLTVLLNKCIKQNKENMIEEVLNVKSRINNGDFENLKFTSPDFSIEEWFGKLEVRMEAGLFKNKRVNKDVEQISDMLDKLIERIEKDKIDSIGVNRKTIKAKNEQAQLLQESIDKIDKKLDELGVNAKTAQKSR